MYKKHPNIEEPDDNLVIWRYIDFTKFVSLLDTKQLFFVRADKVSDSFEGSYTNANKKMREVSYTFMKKEVLESYEKSLENIRKYVLINCWHINDFESAAMWDLYSSKSKGVAIQSSFLSLKKCFDNSGENISIGKMKYIDYNSTIIPEGNLLFSYLHKRKSFEHEKELRALILKFPESESDGFTVDSGKEVCDIGIYVDINIDALIENIYVCPTAPEWFVELVKNVIKKYGFNFNIINSELNKEPIW